MNCEAFETSMNAARQHLCAGDARAAFAQLERAHVLGQGRFVPQLRSHRRLHLGMLRVAWARKDGREPRGQLLRIALVPIGHLTGRLPQGNTGAANLSAFRAMPIAPDLPRLIDKGQR